MARSGRRSGAEQGADLPESLVGRPVHNGTRVSSAGVTSTIPARDFARPLSIARSNGAPSMTSLSLNQTDTSLDSSRSCSSLAAPRRSSQAWQRKGRSRAASPRQPCAETRLGRRPARWAQAQPRCPEPTGCGRARMTLVVTRPGSGTLIRWARQAGRSPARCGESGSRPRHHVAAFGAANCARAERSDADADPTPAGPPGA